jgi:hypothetical protein
VRARWLWRKNFFRGNWLGRDYVYFVIPSLLFVGHSRTPGLFLQLFYLFLFFTLKFCLLKRDLLFTPETF